MGPDAGLASRTPPEYSSDTASCANETLQAQDTLVVWLAHREQQAYSRVAAEVQRAASFRSALSVRVLLSHPTPAS